jgi:hypothetical protein
MCDVVIGQGDEPLPMTPQMLWDQRVSFAYGQMMENPQVTREMVERQATALYGPRPEE